jgi:putative glycosyltransferase (TIGR04348 family)
MIALHALKSFNAIKLYRANYPHLPLIIVLTGTDLYGMIQTSAAAQLSLELADRLVVLQNQGLKALPAPLRDKTRVIYQSARKIKNRADAGRKQFKIFVIGNLRNEKDPFRAARAARQLPATSQIKIFQIGRALSPRMAQMARMEAATNPRFQWLGALPHRQTRQLLAAAHLLAITSRVEGSSNVLCEALASDVPIVAARIPGLIGTLGEAYPGYFSVGDTRALNRLLHRVETDSEFYHSLKDHCAQLSYLVEPAREQSCWQALLAEIVEERRKAEGEGRTQEWKNLD